MSRGDISNTNNESFNLDDENYENGDDAYPEYGEVSNTNDNNRQPSQLWNDQIRQKTRKGRMGSITTQSFEMVPLSDSSDDNELDDFNYDNEEEEDDDDHIRHKSSTIPSGHPHSGDDYTSQTKLPKVVYQYIYPPNVPRSVQLCRPENIAIPACYLLVGLLQGLSGPFTNVYPLDLNASEAQQVRDYFDFTSQ